MKKIITLVLVTVCAASLLSAAPKAKKNKKKTAEVVASTSWTAAFIDIAGIDQVDTIAPASLRHPPEYEVTVEDIQKISNSKFFIYAGYERMMKTLGDAVGSAEMVKISTNNSIKTVTAQTKMLSELFGTQEICEQRTKEYVDTILAGKAWLEENGLGGAKVLCNKNQIFLAEDLGLTVAATFGPGPVTSDQIADAKKNNYVFIIDNVHNPVGSPLAEVAPKSKYVIWRNFPEVVEHNALKKVVSDNIDVLK